MENNFDLLRWLLRNWPASCPASFAISWRVPSSIIFCHCSSGGALGFYILHFPIIQLLVYSGAFRGSPWIFLALTLCLTMAGAVMLWFGVEKRFLSRRRSHAVAATTAAAGAAQPGGA